MYASAVRVSSKYGTETKKHNTVVDIPELGMGLNQQRTHVISRKVSVNVSMTSHYMEQPSQELSKHEIRVHVVEVTSAHRLSRLLKETYVTTLPIYRSVAF
jgi:hypothetical protein